MSLGLLGGTFNPVHYGHLRAAEEVRQRLALDGIVFVPAGAPPLKEEALASAAERYEMVRLAIAGNPAFGISDVETAREGKSYTVDTIEALSREHPGERLLFILGVDAFMDVPYWKEPQRLLGSADFVVIRRPGFPFARLGGSRLVRVERSLLNSLDRAEVERHEARLPGGRTATLLAIDALDISATAIRNHICEGRSARYLLPENVESYIMSKGLYKQ